jgi:predicted secreted protein
MTTPRLLLVSLLWSGLLGLSLGAGAVEPAAPQGVVHLSAQAGIEVPKDQLSVTLTTSREGLDAAAVQAQLKQALDAALAEAKKAAKAEELEVQTGNFSIHPRHASKGGISGWQGSAELVVEGRDMAAIAQLTGRITTLTIARVGYSLSRALREKVEGDVAAQAIAAFRAKAADYARQFGYAGYVVREVNVNAGEPVTYPRPTVMRSQAMGAASGEGLPVEAGKGLVTVNVSGSVQMTR